MDICRTCGLPYVKSVKGGRQFDGPCCSHWMHYHHSTDKKNLEAEMKAELDSRVKVYSCEKYSQEFLQSLVWECRR